MKTFLELHYMFLITISFRSDSACLEYPNNILALCLYSFDGKGDLCQSVRKLVCCDFWTIRMNIFFLTENPSFEEPMYICTNKQGRGGEELFAV